MPNKIKTYLGFDFGTKKIGVAKANNLINQATALETIHYQNEDQMWITVSKLILKWQPHELIVGIPTLLDGKAQPITELAFNFSSQLKNTFSLPIHHVDERLTSIEAKTIIKQQRQAGKKKKTKKGDVDKIAACLILQQWLNE